MPKNGYFQHDNINMILYHRQSSSIFNLKIKYNARFSTFRMDSWLNRPHLLCVYICFLYASRLLARKFLQHTYKEENESNKKKTPTREKKSWTKLLKAIE